MSSDYEHLTGKRDFSTPMPMTGKPYVKTYYDWTHYRWRTDVCILLGAREEAPGVAWADRLENHGKGRTPDRERRDLSPQGQRAATYNRAPRAPKPATPAKPLTIRSRIHAFLRKAGTATTRDIIEALPGDNPKTVTATVNNDPLIKQVGGRKGTGRATPGNEARWVLREVIDEEAIV